MPHIHEKIDFTATAYIVCNNKVLLRMHDKHKLWLGPGGHIELDEDPNQAVIREVKEEVGLDVDFCAYKLDRDVNQHGFSYYEVVPPDYMNMHQVNNEHQHMDMIYLMQSVSDKVVPSGSDKSDEWKWFTKEELHDSKYKIEKIIIMYCEKALEKFNK